MSEKTFLKSMCPFMYGGYSKLSLLTSNHVCGNMISEGSRVIDYSRYRHIAQLTIEFLTYSLSSSLKSVVNM